MSVFATPLINTSALLKIIVVAFAAGAGVVIAFGFLLLGLSRAGKTENRSTRLANYAISALAGLFCIAAVALGVYAMAKKPASSKPKSKSAESALIIRAG
jgi:NADH:ubiquinone oxidoreductase subunit 6 (subunit J)